MKRYLPILLLFLFLTACKSQQEVVYLQDIDLNSEDAIINLNTIKVRPEDKLSIVVICKETQIAMLLNPIENARRIHPSAAVNGIKNSQSSQTNIVSYTVDSNGNIDFPLIGMIHVAGLTREEVAQKIKNEIINHQIVSDPTVFVEFANLHFSVIGEVKSPGSYAITTERITLLDALSQAGDLTIFGKRDQVYVIREIDGKRTKYVVDLRSADLFNSPAYYLQQNDVIYVVPNNTRAGQSTINENNWKSVGLWTSVASLLVSVAVLIFK